MKLLSDCLEPSSSPSSVSLRYSARCETGRKQILFRGDVEYKDTHTHTYTRTQLHTQNPQHATHTHDRDSKARRTILLVQMPSLESMQQRRKRRHAVADNDFRNYVRTYALTYLLAYMFTGQRINKNMFLGSTKKTMERGPSPFGGDSKEMYWDQKNISGRKSLFFRGKRTCEPASQPAGQPLSQPAHRPASQPAGQLAANQTNPLEPSLGHLMPRNLRKYQ